MEINRFREAIPVLTQALTQNHQNYQVICSISYCFSELQENDKSLRYAEQAITVDPEEEWAYRLKGIQLIRRKKIKEGLQYAKKSLDCEPESELTLGNYVLALLNNEQLIEARKIADKLLQTAPDSANSHYISGHVNLNMNEPSEAEKDLRKALEISPEFAEARNKLAVAVLKQVNQTANDKKSTRENEALEHFSESVKLDPNNKFVLDNVKNQFQSASHIFGFIFFLPFLITGLVVTPIFTTVLAVFISLIFVNLILEKRRRKKSLPPEMQNLLKITNYVAYARELGATVFHNCLSMYKKVWIQTLTAFGICLIYLLQSNLPFPENFYFILKLIYWGNSFWIFQRIFYYTGPK